jgi:Ca-activated chloride channel homolog
MEVSFTQPLYLWGLLLVPVLVVVYFVSLKYSKSMALKFANFSALSRASGGGWSLSGFNVLAVRMFALICVILAMSGMVFWYNGETSNKDYVFVIDASASMIKSDANFDPSRLEAAKLAAINFVESVPLTSKIGVVSFAGTSFVNQFLTEDKSVVKEAIGSVEGISVDGTDFGSAIISATNILISSQKAKEIILITDGRDNIGVSEERAVNYAIDHQVVVSSIGIGSREKKDEFDLGVDEETLKTISVLTLGNYYRVESSSDLDSVYSELVKNPTIGKNPVELFYYLWILSTSLLVLDWVLETTVYRRVP